MKNLASERVRLGMSQAEFAAQIGVTRESVARWESGAAMPSVQTLVSMSEFLKCSTDYLLGRTLERLPR